MTLFFFSTILQQVAQSLKRPMASPAVTTESKRPSIIQATSAPPNAIVSKLASPKVLSFTVDPNKTAEQLTVLRSSYTQCPFPEEEEVRRRKGCGDRSSCTTMRCVLPSFNLVLWLQIYRLIETTGLSRGEIKKWFSEQRLLNVKGERGAYDWIGDSS